MNNETSVIELDVKGQQLRSIYKDSLKGMLSKGLNNISNEDLLQCHSIALDYFNHMEKLVGKSALLGANNCGTWATGFAEDCYAVLEEFIEHMKNVKKS
ncbi:hypothetical protein GCM10011332_33170 [Terasakiella brassicae]|uniref:Uncharacterized protein n=1 Tax=Terasakiella brassicae TaxID=1634917 RepID=A0A917CAF5_9PROT|nr:hypothetical protein [Terasakiella brassicae]GGF76525.1 hypothetical protein GCM10011332_33170 [Terasakiella brassicae]